ncbi:unnamed protein product [Cylicostephanus goldi]|uniref:Uncharacterized protein n=1 Tax=Cylicostephanus goldi TaxID=71465 RepID=A0A3P6QKG0_CYLGO|nr:unnamed protein product [Cylicostephanus goldi]
MSDGTLIFLVTRFYHEVLEALVRRPPIYRPSCLFAWILSPQVAILRLRPPRQKAITIINCYTPTSAANDYH